MRFSKVKNVYATFISATANSYPAYMREDLVQEGSIGLYLACVSFDPDKGVPFDAFAKTCIRNRMISAYRSLKRDGDTDELTDSVAADMTDVVSGFDSKSFFVKLREKLSELENDVLDEYLSEKSYSEIADKLNVSEKAVNNAVQRIRKKIRKYYEA